MPIVVRLGEPGECPICGAPHTTCTSGGAVTPIVVRQLPARDGVEVREPATSVSFSTKTYTRKKPR